ncbi:MAG: S41 family peptidase [Candidatus Gracilibacteria bacterium]|jgi:carboxyl-terminal processing protease
MKFSDRQKNVIFLTFAFLIVFMAGAYSSVYYVNQKNKNLWGGELFAKDGSVELSDQQKNTDLSTFWEAWGDLNDKYVDKDAIDKNKMVYGAIKGMVDSLGDPYTVYMDPTESKEFEDNLTGVLEGIGAELTVEDHSLIILSPLKDSPAEKAGILPGDVILKIENEVASDLTLFDAIMKIRGPKGTTVTLTLLRKNSKDPFEVSIVRDSINIDSVSTEKLDNGIVYLRINQFNENTDNEFKKAFSEMVLEPPKGLIIDLRYNGGGFLDTAVNILSYILPSESKAVEMKKRNESDNEIMYTNGGSKILETPLVVLINEGSASASEIVAGAVQDLKRGIIMGSQSYGKGTVQEVVTFSDKSVLRMTIAKWFTPNGHDINKIGITPDIAVEMTEDDYKNKADPQKDAAIKYLFTRFSAE